MEQEIPNFPDAYRTYLSNINLITESSFNNNLSEEQISVILNVTTEFQNLDVKLRLAFGMSEIVLNNLFVQDKSGDLKDCHLLYYKLADLWFAYETYISFYKKITSTGKNKISWLDSGVHSSYNIITSISCALESCKNEIQSNFGTRNSKRQLINYLKYCTLEAHGNQKNNLLTIINKIETNNYNFSHTEILTITYAVRNNFVHNGEATVVPDDFGFRNKKKLLRLLYSYLVIVLLESINKTCSEI